MIPSSRACLRPLVTLALYCAACCLKGAATIDRLGEFPYSQASIQAVGEHVIWVNAFDSVHRSSDRGRTWRAVFPVRRGPAEPPSDVGLMHAIDGDRAFVASGCDLFFTDNGGVAWRRMSSLPTCTAKPAGAVVDLVADSTGSAVYIAGGVFERRVSPGQAPTEYLDPRDPTQAMIAALFKSEDGGRTWRRSGPTVKSFVFTRVRLFKDLLVLSNPFEAYASRNGGQNWYGFAIPQIGPLGNNIQDLEARQLGGPTFLGNRGRGWMMTGAGDVLRSDNSGMSWTRIGGMGVRTNATGRQYQMGLVFVTENDGAALTREGRLFETHDGGVTWLQIRSGGGLFTQIALAWGGVLAVEVPQTESTGSLIRLVRLLQ